MFKTRGQADPSRGIMLVEMLVAFGIISVTFVVIVDAYLASSRATQIAQHQAEVADALAYALADMAREAQTGTNFSVSGIASFGISRTDSATGQPTDDLLYSLNSGQAKIEKTVNSDPSISLVPTDVMVLNFFASAHTFPDLPTRITLEIQAKHRDDENDDRVPLTVVQAHFYERSY